MHINFLAGVCLPICTMSAISVTKEEVSGMTPELLVDHLIDAGFSAYELRKLESKCVYIISNTVQVDYSFFTTVTFHQRIQIFDRCHISFCCVL